MISIQPATSSAQWCLSECTPGDVTPRVVVLNSFPFLIGRLPESSLCLSAGNISKQHAEIVLKRGRLAVRDLGITNGTFVHDRVVSDLAPLHHGDLLQLATEAFRVHRREPDENLRTVSQESFAAVESLCQFDRLMSARAVIPHFQPIVNLSNSRPIGFELLARSDLPGLENPAAMFQAAERLGEEIALSAMLRWEGALAARQLAGQPMLYLNTHPNELGDPQLIPSLEELRAAVPELRLTIEVHEGSV